MTQKRLIDIIKQVFLIIITVLIIALVGVQIWRWTRPNYKDFDLKAFHSNDAKLGYDGYIVTSKMSHLCLVNSKNSKVTPVFIRSDWIDALPTDNVIVYSNRDHVTGICHFDPKDASIYNHKVILEDGQLRIDPSILKMKDTYYLTTTRVEGHLNRDSEDVENGIYTIELYKSQDLSNWEFITDIYSKDSNIEDVELNSDNGLLKVVFEEETIDKGPSQIMVMDSYDGGENWSDPIILLDNGADNEPASLCRADNEYLLFYSSDINNPGQSYNGGSAFMARYDSDYNLTHISEINIQNAGRVLLYQAIVENGKMMLLFSNDYLGNDDLILETGGFRQMLKESTD